MKNKLFFKKAGMSLIEVVLSLAVFCFIVIGTIAAYHAITGLSTQAKFTRAVTSIIKDEFARIRAISKVEPKPNLVPPYVPPYTNKNYFNLSAEYPNSKSLITYKGNYDRRDDNISSGLQLYRTIYIQTFSSGTAKEYKQVNITLADSLTPNRFRPVTLTTNIAKPVVFDNRQTNDRGHLSGIIRDKDTNNPIAAATVTLIPPSGANLTTNSDSVAATLGKYLFSNLLVGSYQVKAEKPGADGYWVEPVVGGLPVNISGGFSITEQDFLLQPFYYGDVKVTVKNDETLAPIGGVTVILIPAYSNQITDANGVTTFHSKINTREAISSTGAVQANATVNFWGSPLAGVTVNKDQTTEVELLMIPKKYAFLNFIVKDTNTTDPLNNVTIYLRGDNISGWETRPTNAEGKINDWRVTINKDKNSWENGQFAAVKAGYKTLGWGNIDPIEKFTTVTREVGMEKSNLSASITPNPAAMMIGGQQAFTGKVMYNADVSVEVTNNWNTEKSWTLSPGGIAYLGADPSNLVAGNVNSVTITATGTGTTYLIFKATYITGGYAFFAQSKAKIDINPPEEGASSGFSITLTPLDASINWGASQNFTAAAQYRASPTEAYQVVQVLKNWEIINPGVGSFSATNKEVNTIQTSGYTDTVTFYGKENAGNAQVKVSATYVGKSAEATANITVNNLTFSLVLNPSTATVPPGGAKTFTVTAYYGTNIVTGSTTFVWSLSNSLGTLSSTCGSSTIFIASNSVGLENLNIKATYIAVDGTGTKEMNNIVPITIEPGGGFVQ